MKKTFYAVVFALSTFHVAHAQLVKNDFMEGINIGESIEKVVYDNKKSPIQSNSWHLSAFHAKIDGASPVAVAPLEYPGYIESGKSNAFELKRLSEHNGSRHTGYSLTNKNTYSSGIYYLTFMMNVSPSTLSGDNNVRGVIMFNGTHTSDFKRVVCYVKRIGKDKVVFGLSEKDGDNEAVVFTDKTYDLEKTNLLVLKYNIDENKASLFVNPKMAKKEPKADVSIDVTIPFFKEYGIRAITVRQRSHHSEKIGGLRFAKDWTSAIGVE